MFVDRRRFSSSGTKASRSLTTCLKVCESRRSSLHLLTPALTLRKPVFQRAKDLVTVPSKLPGRLHAFSRLMTTLRIAAQRGDDDAAP